MQSIIERDGVLRPARVLDTLLDCAHRTVRKSLQPQDSRKVDTCRHPGIELEANDLTRAAGSSEIAERPFDVASRASLVAQEVVRDGNHPLAHHRSFGLGLVAAKEENLRARVRAV